MAVTTSEKFNFPMATSGSDPAPNRAAWMAIFDSLEDNALALGYGPLQDRPATPAKPVAWFDTVNARLSVHTGTGGTWTDVSAPLGDTPTAMAYNAAGAEGVSNRAARADHKHALPAITRGDLPAITDSDLPTVPVAKGGTGATTLASGSFLRGNGTGAIQTRTWEGQDGKKNYVTEVIADEVNFVGGKKDNPGFSGGGSFEQKPATREEDGFMPLDDDDSLPF